MSCTHAEKALIDLAMNIAHDYERGISTYSRSIFAQRFLSAAQNVAAANNTTCGDVARANQEALRLE